MEQHIIFCVIIFAITGLSSGVGVLPDSVNGSVGGSVTFNTSVTPGEFLSIQWKFGSEIVILHTLLNYTNPDYKDRITLTDSTGSLELRNLALTDSGLYDLSMIQTGILPITGGITLNVFEPVSNVRVVASNTDLVEFNDTVTLSCSASGSPESFLWLNNSVEVPASDRVQITDGGAVLTIVNVSRYDNGSYTSLKCQAFNPVSNSISDEELLFVNYGPDSVTLTTAPSAEYYGEGSIVSFTCSADSRPVPHFEWFRNGEILSSTGAQINLVMEQSGNYSCQAFNSKTLRYTTSQPVEISVLKNVSESFVSTSYPPVEGSSVNLTCDASGSAPFSREWRINDTDLQPPPPNIVFYEQNRVLSFTNLARKDNGKYTCIINNPVSSQTADYIMNVNYGPENVQIPDPGKVQEGTTLKLNCSAESEPTANFIWTKDGTTLGQSQQFTKDNIQLSDSGVYICQATNDVTMKSLEASHFVNVTEKQGQPTDHCSTGCIVGIVIGCIAVILIVSVGVFYALKKKRQKPKLDTRTDGVGQDNSANGQNQEVQYADVRFVKKDGVVVQLSQQNNTEYAEVRKNNRPPSHPPTYDAHMQREGRRAAPEPPTLYSEVRPK